MKRGDVVVAAAKGAFSGKPRPAIIVQTDLLNPTHPSVILAPVTSELRQAEAFRIAVEPDAGNGLRARGEIMVDKLITVPRDRIQQRIGHLDTATRSRLDRALAVVLGLV